MNIEKPQQIGLKELVLNFVSIIKEEKEVASIENYMHEMSRKSNLDLHDVKNIYNLLFSIYNTDVDTTKGRSWESVEDDFIITYVNMSRNSKVKEKKPITAVLDDLGEILINRSSGGIGFRYYNVLAKKDKKSTKNKGKKNNKVEVKKSAITQSIREVVPDIKEDRAMIQPIIQPEEDSDDLLIILSEIVNNVELAEVDVTTLFKGILTLSKKAVISSSKNELNLLKQQLENERAERIRLKTEHDKLKENYSMLKEEIDEFSKLDGKEKIKHFQKFNNNINSYIVNANGIVEVKNN